MAIQQLTQAPPPSLRCIHALLSVQSLLVVLVSVNRLGPWTLGNVAGNEALRWVELNNLLVLPLVSLGALFLLKQHLEQSGPARDSRAHGVASLLFLVGVYLLGAGYGDHEVTNFLHTRFCADDQTSDLCRIVVFHDDQFSHWLFFAGFVLVNGALMLLQALFPYTGRVGWGDALLLAVNGLFIGLGVFANLAFEQIGLDLYVIAALAALALTLVRRCGAQPLLRYYATAFTFGLAATGVVKVVYGNAG